MPGVTLCSVCGDRQGLLDGSACPQCGGTRDPIPVASLADIARERLHARAMQTRATLSALAGLLDQYGLADQFADSLTAIGNAVHQRHNALAAEIPED